MEHSQSPSVDGGEASGEKLSQPRRSDTAQDEGSREPEEITQAKPGRKKNPNNQAARRDQNRIAQREFRLRKQQRIRDLEARVEILSGSKEETHNHGRAIIQGLMEENARLRGFVRDLGAFLGEGLAGPLLAKTGWDMKQFQDFISKADSDTAYEAYIKAKNQVSDPNKSSDTFADSRKRKRNSLGESNSGAAGASHDASANGRAQSPGELPNLLPSGRQSFTVQHEEAPGSFSSLIDTFSGSAGAPYINMGNPSVGTRQLPPPRDPYGSGSYPSSSMNPFSFSQRQSGTSALLNSPAAQASSTLSGPERRQRSMMENEPKKNEAGKLIKQVNVTISMLLVVSSTFLRYHLDNYKRSPGYFLPTSLRPTLVQRTVPHDNLIDGVVYPEIRDRMILLKDRFDLAECLTMLLWSTIVHGDDVLAHINWELGEDWLRTYGFLVDDTVLASVNRWRRVRGDPELKMGDINPDPVSPSS
ncbi:hypothetical protein BS47DRAFT_1378924 [Hydnum rufescens UP504]|uniref:BZIP domain-containing protein n=1 Tax=Hydnum rufescens UP504 TaxID=1448309 RepID=A0A9P6B9T3_9AGAM|nr:hypothetical protein BS47DRAFT_1378924 [Hydnum rufescens UP504]